MLCFCTNLFVLMFVSSPLPVLDADVAGEALLPMDRGGLAQLPPGRHRRHSRAGQHGPRLLTPAPEHVIKTEHIKMNSKH